MFGDDLPWYAESVSNQHSRVVSDKQRRRDGRIGVRISRACRVIVYWDDSVTPSQVFVLPRSTVLIVPNPDNLTI